MPDISGIISQSGIQLEAQAFNTFGAAVANQAPGLLANALSAALGTNGTLTPVGANPETATWDPTPYASLIASGAGGYDPRTKFLFRVTFRFVPDVATQLATLMGIASTGNFAASVTFTVKQIDLPKYKFEYEDNVNYYNFRTQILKRVTHDELGFSMYDAVGNQALNFINAYLQLLVPSSRQDYTSGYDLWDHGFAFTNGPSQGNDAGQRAVLGAAGQSVNILDVMIIDQYYLSRDPSAGLVGPQIVNAIKANSYVFTNPKLTHFEIGDQDHEKNEPNMIACGFVFDSLYIQTGQLASAVNSSRPTLAGGDILDNVQPNSFPSAVGGGGGAINPYLSLLAGQVGRQVSQTVSQVINSSGLAATVPGGGAASAAVGGALGVGAARTLASLGSTAPGISVQPLPILSDNSAPASSVAVLSSQDASSDTADFS